MFYSKFSYSLGEAVSRRVGRPLFSGAARRGGPRASLPAARGVGYSTKRTLKHSDNHMQATRAMAALSRSGGGRVTAIKL